MTESNESNESEAWTFAHALGTVTQQRDDSDRVRVDQALELADLKARLDYKAEQLRGEIERREEETAIRVQATELLASLLAEREHLLSETHEQVMAAERRTELLEERLEAELKTGESLRASLRRSALALARWRRNGKLRDELLLAQAKASEAERASEPAIASVELTIPELRAEESRGRLGVTEALIELIDCGRGVEVEIGRVAAILSKSAARAPGGAAFERVLAERDAALVRLAAWREWAKDRLGSDGEGAELRARLDGFIGRLQQAKATTTTTTDFAARVQALGVDLIELVTKVGR